MIGCEKEYHGMYKSYIELSSLVKKIIH